MLEILERIEAFGVQEREKISKALEIAGKETGEKTLKEIIEELAAIRADCETITAAIILQCLKKKAISKAEAEEKFGAKATELAETVLKTESIQKKAGTEKKEEALRKILLSMSQDLRVIIVAFAGKIIELKENPSSESAKEAEEIYSPLAHKLGMSRLKNLMDEEAFKILEPEKYAELSKTIEEKREEREKQVEIVKKTLKEKLKQANIEAEITGRAKQLHSIWKKMGEKGKGIEEIYDLLAVRIITENQKDCYQILGIVHELWQPIPSKFKDYIAKPKSNLYQSLHTTIIGPNQKPIEVQIRTKEMHYAAETGIAAHWKYKKEDSMGKMEKKISWLKEAIDWMQDKEKAKDFLNELKLDFFENEIFAFTPKGQAIELPEGATPIDFAFAVHSDLGFKCEKAKVNGKIVPLDYALENGDSVEIITSEKQEPKRQWLSFVKTSKASAKIRQALQIQVKEKKPEKIKKAQAIKAISITSRQDKAVRLAKCCKPVPGDELTAFLTTKRKISVHRADCENAQAKDLKKVEVSWNVKGKESFAVELRVLANERPGLLSELLEAFAKFQAKVTSANAKTTLNNKTECNFEIETKNLKELEELLSRLKAIKGVQLVERT
ncbi:MAG: bifunctional (p)ppGpp synthetase/guanosine-3',5'-bis(diphosphate) 3'-pyrophosphohydrolase [Candidatus Diapherotrites archaeon]|uniref:Bifunctional (P)ppGpp synthetase/guanosine-3',5'-bis(Diphosphate) 3'-pyrophosphohydrolase n=1 Tax=Candidatus Iainarchaeum sp. TaxID=3101447 RepID=A0A8T4KZN5_9ARCH|nr:bifunctional (p)ppGpp synthetase/guanosine-3',5'-bis(diphosphate) 3'-pyrophosphohydrolase [Candidatus Diapherotrites archaeon]